jgi:hypothetical protein
MEMALRGGENGMTRAAERIPVCEGSVRSLYEPFNFLVSAIILQSRYIASSQPRTYRILLILSACSRWPLLLNRTLICQLRAPRAQ